MKKNPKTKTTEPKTSIINCNFTGIKWDGQAIEAVNNVSKALLNITELFKSQNIHINSLLQIDSDGNAKTNQQ